MVSFWVILTRVSKRLLHIKKPHFVLISQIVEILKLTWNFKTTNLPSPFGLYKIQLQNNKYLRKVKNMIITAWQKPRRNYLSVYETQEAQTLRIKLVSLYSLRNYTHTYTHPFSTAKPVILEWPVWANFNISIFPLPTKFSFQDISIPQTVWSLSILLHTELWECLRAP